MSQKGNIIVPILVIALLISLGLAGYLFWQNQQLQNQTTNIVDSPTVTPQTNISPIPSISNETDKWDILTGTDLKISFKYPSNWYTFPGGDVNLPQIFVQNVPQSNIGTDALQEGQFSMIFSDIPSYKFKTVEELETELDKKEGTDGFYIGDYVGKVKIENKQKLNINNNPVFVQTITYTERPDLHITTYYILDGNGKVTKLETIGQKAANINTFNKILQSFNFEN